MHQKNSTTRFLINGNLYLLLQPNTLESYPNV